jgi:hypothetical protein
MSHRVTLDGRVQLTDLRLEVSAMVDDDTAVTPAQARALAVELVERADAADGHRGPHGFVTRWEVLAELRQLEADVERMRGLLSAG